MQFLSRVGKKAEQTFVFNNGCNCIFLCLMRGLALQGLSSRCMALLEGETIQRELVGFFCLIMTKMTKDCSIIKRSEGRMIDFVKLIVRKWSIIKTKA